MLVRRPPDQPLPGKAPHMSDASGTPMATTPEETATVAKFRARWNPRVSNPKARCESCGWWGPTRYYQHDAQRDADDHNAAHHSAAPAPILSFRDARSVVAPATELGGSAG